MRTEQKKVDTGISAAALNAAVSSSVMNVTGYNQLTLRHRHTNVSATEIQMKIYSVDPAGNEHELDAADGSGTPNIVYAQAVHRRTVSGDAKFTWNFPINEQYIKLVYTSTGGAAGDKLTVDALLGVL